MKLANKSVKVTNYVIWPEYWITPWLKVGAWYEKEDMQYPTELQFGDQTHSRIVPDLQITVTPNFPVGLEAYQYTHKRKDANGNVLDKSMFNALVDFAF